MDITVIVLRLVHVACGVFWAGTIIFVATYLEPSVRAAGPAGASVMQGLFKRHYLTVMPVVAGLTILSGIDLLRRASAGFEAAWFGSPTGMTLTAGGLVALVAFAIGVGVMRPAALRIISLGQAAAAASDPAAKEARLAEMAPLRGRVMISGRWVAGLLTASVAAMAVARYLG